MIYIYTYVLLYYVCSFSSRAIVYRAYTYYIGTFIYIIIKLNSI